MRPLRSLVAIGCLILSSFPAFAQGTLTPRVGGYVVSCRDALGHPVETLSIPGLQDMAMSRIEPNGVPSISINPMAAGAAPVVQLFAYEHECGHHSSGDVISATFYRHLNPDREKTADRIGIRTLRDRFNISRNDAQAIAATFIRNPPYPGYLPGPERAAWILACFDTTSDDCAQENPVPPPAPADDCEANYNSCKADVGTQNQCIHRDAQDCANRCGDTFGFCYQSCLNSKDNPTSCIHKVHDGISDCRDTRNQCRANQ